jgi:phosphate transport system substrate-binding protein
MSKFYEESISSKNVLCLLLVAFVASLFGAGPAGVDPSLPAYRPQPAVPPKDAGYILPDGSIRIVGFDDMDGIIGRLNDLFVRSHPGVKFTYVKGNSLAALYALMFDSSVFAPMGIEFSGSLPYTDTVHGPPFSIRVAHASLSPNAKLSPLAIIVNTSNPVESLTVNQITSIFTESTRKRVITHWSQLGVTGELGPREIHPCGLPWSDHYPSEDFSFGEYMFLRKLGGGPPVRNYNMLSNYAQVVKNVSQDPLSIGITTLNQVRPEVRLVGIAGSDLGGLSRGGAEEIIAGRYPFDRYLYIYGRLVSGKPFDPLAKEYMRMVLSRDGQEIIAGASPGYLPLNVIEVGEELAKLQ